MDSWFTVSTVSALYRIICPFEINDKVLYSVMSKNGLVACVYRCVPICDNIIIRNPLTFYAATILCTTDNPSNHNHIVFP